LFTEEQLTLLEGVLDEYREISGQGKVARKEAIVTRVTRQFVTVHHENDIEATKKLQNVGPDLSLANEPGTLIFGSGSP
jgi:hypothetical protein